MTFFFNNLEFKYETLKPPSRCPCWPFCPPPNSVFAESLTTPPLSSSDHLHLLCSVRIKVARWRSPPEPPRSPGPRGLIFRNLSAALLHLLSSSVWNRHCSVSASHPPHRFGRGNESLTALWVIDSFNYDKAYTVCATSYNKSTFIFPLSDAINPHPRYWVSPQYCG